MLTLPLPVGVIPSFLCDRQAAALSRLQKTYVKKTAEYVVGPRSGSSFLAAEGSSACPAKSTLTSLLVSPLSQDTIASNSLSSSGTSSHQTNLSTSTSTRPIAPFQTPTSSLSTSPVSAGDQRREDLARGIEQTKKGLNQFIFNLRGDKDRGGGGNAEEREREEKDTRERIEQREREGKEKEREKAEAGTMRGVRLKREAEEAGESRESKMGEGRRERETLTVAPQSCRLDQTQTTDLAFFTSSR